MSLTDLPQTRVNAALPTLMVIAEFQRETSVKMAERSDSCINVSDDELSRPQLLRSYTFVRNGIANGSAAFAYMASALHYCFKRRKESIFRPVVCLRVFVGGNGGCEGKSV
jgi:hypothetical protein